MDKNHLSEQLISLEKSLLTDEVRTSASLLGDLLHDDFEEISQSGTRYGKAEVLNSLPVKGSSSGYEAYGFEVKHLSQSIAQVLFETISVRAIDNVKCKSLRSSLWKFDGERWQIIFHQGTVKGEI